MKSGKPVKRSRKERREEKEKTKKKAVITDERFAEVYTNPRFKKPYKHKSKITVDSRFQHMFHDKTFGGASSGKVDKYGRKLEAEERKPGAHLKKFYHLAKEELSEEGEDQERLEKLRKLARGEIQGNGSDSDSSTDLEEEAKEEVESEPEEEIPLGDASKRIAVQNLDWDKLQALDILVLLSSFLPATGAILKVSVHSSKYGEKQMALENRFGPQLDPEPTSSESKRSVQDIAEKGASKSKEEGEAEVDEAKLRRYEQQRLKYYFAVVEFDSAATANHIYEECDGVEFEHSAVVFDLRFIPDDVVIDTSVRDHASSIPEDYKAPEFITKALQSTKVELSWDQDDASRERLRKWTNSSLKGKALIEDKDLEAFIGSDNSDDEEEAAADDSKARAREKFRSMLQSVNNESSDEDSENDIDSEDDQEPALSAPSSAPSVTKHEKVVARLDSAGKAEKKSSSSTEVANNPVDKSVFNDPFFMNPKKHNKREKQKYEKKKLREKREERAKSEAKSKAELELLLMDEQGQGMKSSGNQITGFDYNTLVEGEKLLKKGKVKGRGKQKKRKLAALKAVEADTFEVNVSDPRFEGLYTSADFSVDPTSSHYKDTKATRSLEKERRKRREAQIASE